MGFFTVLYFLLLNQKKYLLNLESLVKEETQLDMLTKVFTRKFGDTYLKECFCNFSNTQLNSVVFIIDIDDFKVVNDTYGHATGDIVLQKLSQAVLHMIRSTDCYIRWGGEEFVLVLHDASREDANEVANKIVHHVFDMEFEDLKHKFKISISMGGSTFLQTDKSYEDAMKRADDALYYIKKNGKNNHRID